ncbi:hypothetical protein KO504_17085 [Winogradskyella psychrotolerans]|uniref:hypothetical protein n=1 Tax=Winogradskyella psychrotolerans TaxID=1344585 RepID=UPI001C072C19|nr:hypothetical protein [Winogradskyella psychrotolerans]MBU2923067.1 hypothetical protein [Winogradskyella psychrotolerans]
MSFVEKYKRGLAIIAGTLFLFIALYLPARYALGLTEREDVWTSINWIFLGLALIFLWGEVAKLAQMVQNFIKKKTE